MFPINSLFRTPSFNNTDNSNPISAIGGMFRRDRKLPTAPTIAPPVEVSPMPQVQPQVSKPIEMLPEGRSFEMRPSPMPTPMAGGEPATQPEMWRRNLPTAQTPVPLSDIRPQPAQMQAPRPIPRPDVPTLEGRMVAPGSYDAQRRDYLMQGVKRNPDGSIAEGKDGGMQFKRSGKDIALAALGGLMKGGVLGAAAGGIGAAVSPKFGREMNWEMYQKPRALEEEGRAREEQAQERQRMMDAIGLQRTQIGMDADIAQTELNRARTHQALNPAIKRETPQVELRPMVDPGTGAITLVNVKDPANAGKGYVPYEKPGQESLGDKIRQSEIEQEASEDPQRISNDSYNARGGDQYVFSKLPPDVQKILQTGKIGGRQASKEEIETAQEIINTGMKNGAKASATDLASARQAVSTGQVEEMDASFEERLQARKYFDSEIQRQKKADLEFTQAEDKKKKAQRAVGKLPGTASGGGTRSLADLVNQNFKKP